jgi:hypothetical protein
MYIWGKKLHEILARWDKLENSLYNAFSILEPYQYVESPLLWNDFTLKLEANRHSFKISFANFGALRVFV